MKQDISRLEQEIARVLKQADKTDRREDKKYGSTKGAMNSPKNSLAERPGWLGLRRPSVPWRRKPNVIRTIMIRLLSDHPWPRPKL
jgi:hypothetical protein